MTDWQMLIVVLIGMGGSAMLAGMICYENGRAAGRAAGFDAGSEHGERWGKIDGRRETAEAIFEASREAQDEGRITQEERLRLIQEVLEALNVLYGKEKP